MNAVEITVTGPAEWADGCVSALLDARLIGAAHVLPIRSRYWWQGAVETAEEVRVMMHTTAQNKSAVCAAARSSHPYAVCCIISQDLTDVDPDYLQWILTETLVRS